MIKTNNLHYKKDYIWQITRLTKLIKMRQTKIINNNLTKIRKIKS